MKKLAALIFLLIISLLGALRAPQVFAGNCGTDDFIDTEGRWGPSDKAYVTGCYGVNIGGNTTYQGNWDCGPGRQCFVFDRQQGKCGVETYFGKPTFCFSGDEGAYSGTNLTRVPYSGCSSGYCVIDTTPEPQGKCGVNTYQNQRTFCSASALNRIIVPNYSGCNNGEFCVLDLISQPGKICGKDLFQNQPTYCSVSAANRIVVTYSGCRSVGELCVTDITENTVGATGAPRPLCTMLTKDVDRANCDKCFKQGGSWTAIGCIPTNPSQFIAKILTIGIGLAGGIAFLLILFGGFQILTSTGNPEQLNAGRELVSSAIAGLLLIIFSVFILKVIGVNILGIPGFQ